MCALLKQEKYKHFGITFCRATIYKYVEDGVFLTLTNQDLPEKGDRKKKHKTIRKKQSRASSGTSIERSARRKGAKRTTVYYCHAYSSYERGTNENINRMIRRQFPKGTDFDKVTAAEVKRVETWLNDYPREILGFMSSAEAFKIAFDRAA